MKKIILTGGGTAGHVTPNLALVERLKEEGFDICYVGSINGIEKELAKGAGLEYRSVSTGKFRRYLSVKSLSQNFKDIFRVIRGLNDAKKVLTEIKPDIVFSKGGFVSVPVVIAANRADIPVVIHESDITPGLANKIAYPFAKVVCAAFEETLPFLPKGRGVFTGAPVRAELLNGDAAKARKLCGFTRDLPTLLIMGGSSGSVKINDCVDTALATLLKFFNIVHLRGKGKAHDAAIVEGYAPFEYLNRDMPDIFALCDVVVSRAGANSISELLALKLPNLLIPLSKKASRGDQILNAASFEKRGYSAVLREETLTPDKLAESVLSLYRDRDKFAEKMAAAAADDAVRAIVEILVENSQTL